MTEASRHLVFLRSRFFLSDRRVPPGECGFTSSDGDPGTNGVITKLAAEDGIKAKSAILQAPNAGWSWTLPGSSTHSRMKILAASIALALLLLTSRGVTVANTSSDSAEGGIRRLNAEEVDAFLKNDRAAMARLWSDDFVVTNPLNKLVTKQQVLGMVDSGFLVITSFDRQIEYLRVYGDVVVVAGREVVVWGGKMPNAGKSENLRFTAVWMKQGGRWQQIARHANIVPPQAAVSPP